MNKIGVSLKLDVTKMDKARFFTGAKGTYCDCTVFIDLDQLDQYGNSGMITQDVTKEEREQKVLGNILGNCKVFWSEGGQAPQQSKQEPNTAPGGPGPENDFDDDIPFAKPDLWLA